MKRRDLIILLASAALTRSSSASGQQPTTVPRIGIIDDSPRWDPFRRSLRDLGYLEGQHLVFESGYSGGVPEQLVLVATELVRRPVNLIATYGTPASRAAKQATTTIPIVMIGIGDPIGAGLVSNLARPGANITGNTILSPDIAGKRLQLLKEAIPSLSRVAFLWNPHNASHPAQLADLQGAAPQLGIDLLPVAARQSDELEDALAAMLRQHPQGFLMTNDPLHLLSIGKIIDFLALNRLPAMYQSREIAMAGGLLSYGASLADLFRRGAGYVDKILRGTKPADLPIEQPVKFELTVNLKTAEAIGLSIPQSFLVRADEVIN